MPIYEYICEQCEESTEAIQRLSDPPLVECPKCGGKLRRKVSAPAFQFKGSGWYVTDYARKGSGGGSEDSSSSSSSSSDSSSGESSAKKSESKPETVSKPSSD